MKVCDEPGCDRKTNDISTAREEGWMVAEDLSVLAYCKDHGSLEYVFETLKRSNLKMAILAAYCTAGNRPFLAGSIMQYADTIEYGMAAISRAYISEEMTRK